MLGCISIQMEVVISAFAFWISFCVNYWAFCSKKKIKLGINVHYSILFSFFFYISISISSSFTIHRTTFLRKLGTTAIAHKNKSNERRTCDVCELFAPISCRRHNGICAHCANISTCNTIRECRSCTLTQSKSQKVQSHCTHEAPEGGVTHG